MLKQRICAGKSAAVIFTFCAVACKIHLFTPVPNIIAPRIYTPQVVNDHFADMQCEREFYLGQTFGGKKGLRQLGMEKTAWAAQDRKNVTWLLNDLHNVDSFEAALADKAIVHRSLEPEERARAIRRKLAFDLLDDVPSALSHYTLHQFGWLLCDIQGIYNVSNNTFYLSDPAIACQESYKEMHNIFGNTNLGRPAIENFLKRHKCNRLCKLLHLPEVKGDTKYLNSKKIAVEDMISEKSKQQKERELPPLPVSQKQLTRIQKEALESELEKARRRALQHDLPGGEDEGDVGNDVDDGNDDDSDGNEDSVGAEEMEKRRHSAAIAANAASSLAAAKSDFFFEVQKANKDKNRRGKNKNKNKNKNKTSKKKKANDVSSHNASVKGPVPT